MPLMSAKRAGKRPMTTRETDTEDDDGAPDQQAPTGDAAGDAADDVSSALSELEEQAVKKKWAEHMNWCNRKKAQLVKGFTAIGVAVDEGARTTLAL